MRLLDSYLELGVVAMTRAAAAGWFGGHYGAALLAGYYMNREHDLPEHVKAGIERTCEAYRAQQPVWFFPLDQEEAADTSLLERVIAGLADNVAQLRTSGHGLALGVLALKALRERPDLIRPSIVEGLVKLLKATTEDRQTRYWGIANYFEITDADVQGIEPYQTTVEMAARTFDELHTVIPGRVIDGQRYHFAGEVVHSVTHAQALSDLERFGYGELVESGMRNHHVQLYLDRQMPDFVREDEVREPAFEQIFSPVFWEKTYSDPHALKLPYAALDLLKRLPVEKRAAAERNLCKLLTIMD
ncbi:hypothetical protein BRE01_52660 [Brevibacillus reuszeri]|uniref:Uncharacterized protein n=1 Tax=Brevibacillus reuszeri TaxID=54915 RepID=A0A0K9YJU8_9BACL|nr:hypothetical protein [Brevibacillus reuszeri]KNB69043.1 hypothetical protein ADS79_31490 [Brevibacillus reuszeri]MED1859322.1 hypothetical protein [Brevibacillus reuszeri]GED71564.1 hypothetical protein BRE01_52660 [Brevibacillus reuszeri]